MPKISHSTTLILAVLALAGCAQPWLPRAMAGVVIPDPAEQVCADDGKSCDVEVHVTVTPGGQCQVTLPGQISVLGTAGPDRRINWNLANDSTEFNFQFVQIKIPDNGTRPEFVGIFVSPNKQHITAYDRRTVLKKVFPYTLEIEMSRVGGGSTSCGFDPGIINRG